MKFEYGTNEKPYMAVAYGGKGCKPISEIPEKAYRKIHLKYPDGKFLVLVYEQAPDDAEMRDAMLHLQIASGKLGFEITIEFEDGTTLQAPPLY